jgi:hypothetical protein
MIIFDRSLGQRHEIVPAAQEVVSAAATAHRLLLAARFEGCLLASTTGRVLDRLSLGEIANAVCVRDQIGFAAYGANGLVVAKLAQDRLTFLSQLRTSGWSHDVELWSDYALLADWDAGLHIINIRDPATPRLIGSVPSPGTTIALAVSPQGSRPMVATAEGHAGIALVDLSDPQHPHLISRNSLGLNSKDVPHPPRGGWAHGLAWAGNYLFVANWKRGLAIVDVSRPERPHLVMESSTQGTALGVAAEASPNGGFLVVLAEGETGIRMLLFHPS